MVDGRLMTVLGRLVRARARVALLRGACKMNRRLSLLLRRLTMKVRNTVRIGRRPTSMIVVSSIVVWMAVLTASRLRNIWHNLHPTGYDTCRSAAPGSIS